LGGLKSISGLNLEGLFGCIGLSHLCL
jgi:hypothetical protein